MASGEGFRELGDLIDRLESHELTVQDVRSTNGALIEERGISVQVTASLEFLKTVAEGPDNGIGAEIVGELPSCTFEVKIPNRPSRTDTSDDGSRVVGEKGSGEGDGVDTPENDGAVERGDKTDHSEDEGSEPILPGETGQSTKPETGEATSNRLESGVGGDVSAAPPGSSDGERGGESDSASTPSSSDESISKTAAIEDDGPYYKNVDLLAEVYEKHDTFAEMTEALGVDVTPATVRQHMVNHGIHPESRDTSTSNEESREQNDEPTSTELSEQLESAKADGIGLPEGVTLEKLVETVVEAKTFYEARTKLDLDDETGRQLLSDLNLLDLVTSRLANKHESNVAPEDVYERIHTS